LVLLFNVFTIYPQWQIHRIQFEPRKQIGAFDRLEDRTAQVYKIAALACRTGPYHRQSGEQRLAEEISRSQRQAWPLTVLMLDADGLKQINDSFGYPAGELTLRHFAERLQSAIPGSDVPTRLGGDEFLVLLPACEGSEVQPMEWDCRGRCGTQIPIGFAVGWADYLPGNPFKR
jgi:GGDEF domain-containing protein